jgi:hypothetical protein
MAGSSASALLERLLDALAVARRRQPLLAQDPPLPARAERGAEVEPGLGPLGLAACPAVASAIAASTCGREARVERPVVGVELQSPTRWRARSGRGRRPAAPDRRSHRAARARSKSASRMRRRHARRWLPRSGRAERAAAERGAHAGAAPAAGQIRTAAEWAREQGRTRPPAPRSHAVASAAAITPRWSADAACPACRSIAPAG